MTNIPEWLTTSEEYSPKADRDGFVTRSLLSVMGILRSFRANAAVGNDGLPVPLKLAATLILILACSVSRYMIVTYIVLAAMLVRIIMLKGELIARILGSAILAALFSAVILVPSIWLGSPKSMLTISIKVFVAVGLVGILANTTPWNKLTAGLSFYHVPQVFIMTLDLTLKYIAILGTISVDMLNALRLRSVGINRAKGRSLAGILGMLFLKSRQMADETYDAMRCRGY